MGHRQKWDVQQRKAETSSTAARAFEPHRSRRESYAVTNAGRSGVARRLDAASALQASGFRADVTVFRANATAVAESALRSAFRRNTAACVSSFEAAHNPEVAGSNPAPATEGPRNGAFSFCASGGSRAGLRRPTRDLFAPYATTYAGGHGVQRLWAREPCRCALLPGLRRADRLCSA